MPSLKEPLGLCALEAMAAGVPVAAANVGGLREFVEPEKTGMLFNPRDPADMSDAITKILASQLLRDHLTSTAKKMVLDDFSPQYDHNTHRRGLGFRRGQKRRPTTTTKKPRA